MSKNLNKIMFYFIYILYQMQILISLSKIKFKIPKISMLYWIIPKIMACR